MSAANTAERLSIARAGLGSSGALLPTATIRGLVMCTTFPLGSFTSASPAASTFLAQLVLPCISPPRTTFGTELLLGPVDGFFDPDKAAFYDPLDIAHALPVPLVSPADPAAGMLTSAALSSPRQTLDSIKVALADGFSAVFGTPSADPHPSLEIDLVDRKSVV